MDAKTKAALRQNFDSAANEPGTWNFVAGNLGVSAGILEEHYTVELTDVSEHARVVRNTRVEGPMLMLRACRMECLLKALYVANGNRLGVNGRFVPPKGKSHDLVTLAREANLSLTLEAECLLGYLGQFITQGRYPVGTRSPDAFRVLASGAPRSKIWSAEGEGEYKALDKRLGAEVGRRIRETMSA